MITDIDKSMLRINVDMEDYAYFQNLKNRVLYLCSMISSADSENGGYCLSITSQLVADILDYNRQDKGKPVEEREPIKLFINSPGGSVSEGFALVSAIELSKTPVYTVNVGEWSSMAFLIGITGHRRFSFPNMQFLMHDGSTIAYGSANKAQDKMKFEERFEQEVVKAHVLKYSNMKEIDYDALARVEYYLLPEDAKERGFIDEIITDIDDIL